MIRNRKLGHKHTLTVPTVRKGVGVAQAAKQVSRVKSSPVGTVSKPGSDYTMFPQGGKVGPNYPGIGAMNNPSYDSSNWVPNFQVGGEVGDPDYTGMGVGFINSNYSQNPGFNPNVTHKKRGSHSGNMDITPYIWDWRKHINKEITAV